MEIHTGKVSGKGFRNKVISWAWPYRLTARTEPSQGLNRGSIPRRVTSWEFSVPKSSLPLDVLQNKDKFVDYLKFLNSKKTKMS